LNCHSPISTRVTKSGLPRLLFYSALVFRVPLRTSVCSPCKTLPFYFLTNPAAGLHPRPSSSTHGRIFPQLDVHSKDPHVSPLLTLAPTPRAGISCQTEGYTSRALTSASGHGYLNSIDVATLSPSESLPRSLYYLCPDFRLH